jgi:uncharacterized protein
MKSSIQPTPGKSRIQALDVLRGFALLGILVVNMPYMNNPMLMVMSDLGMWNALQDTAGLFVIKALFESKFFVLFSFLFGYGFWLFLNKKQDDSSSVVPVFRRRLFYLLLFGIAHVVFLWSGDILVFYALFGFILLLFRRSPDRKAVKWAIGFLLVPVVLSGLMALFVYMGSQNADARAAMDQAFSEQAEGMKELVNEAIVVYSTGTFAEMIDMRVKEYTTLLPGVFFFYPNVIAMFLLGMVAARRRYLHDINLHHGLYKKLLVWGLGVGLPLGVAYAYIFFNTKLTVPSLFTFLSAIITGFGSPLLMFGYLSAILLLLQGGYFKKLMEMLASIGRMALTNYLMQSVITSILFLNWGFGFYGQVTILQGLGLTVAIFILQIIFSSVWLRYFRFGPLEWLWRSLTYQSFQDMRRKH